MVRMARSALAEWNRLDIETKRYLQREASDVRERLFEVAAALGARLRDSSGEGLSWEDARNLALVPRADFVLAREIPAILLDEPDIDRTELASRLGNPVLQVLESALAIAEADGFIERADGRWRVTEFGDQALAESDDVALMEAAITEYLQRVGLAASDELAVGVGCVDSAESGFLDALERALAAGGVEWLGPATYGLPAEQLAAMDPPGELARGSRGGTRDLKDLVVDLGKEVNELRVAVAHARDKAESPLADSSPRSHGGHARSRKLAAKAVAAGIRRYADHRAPAPQSPDSPDDVAAAVRAAFRPAASHGEKLSAKRLAQSARALTSAMQSTEQPVLIMPCGRGVLAVTDSRVIQVLRGATAVAFARSSITEVRLTPSSVAGWEAVLAGRSGPLHSVEMSLFDAFDAAAFLRAVAPGIDIDEPLMRLAQGAPPATVLRL